jgi:hypothetical protein
MVCSGVPAKKCGLCGSSFPVGELVEHSKWVLVCGWCSRELKKEERGLV